MPRFFFFVQFFLHRGGAVLHKHFRKHVQKAALASDMKKVEISLKFRGLAKTPISKKLRSSKFESYALTIQPRMLKIPKN